MYYGKLPILLLAQLSASSPNSTNSQIASYILNHLEEVRDSSILRLPQFHQPLLQGYGAE